MLFSCLLEGIYIRKTVRFLSKQSHPHHHFIWRPPTIAHNCKMVYCRNIYCACSVDHINPSIIQLQEYNIRKPTVTHPSPRLEKRKKKEKKRLEKERIKTIHMHLQIFHCKNDSHCLPKWKTFTCQDVKITK